MSPNADDFFKEHRISEEVASARPYVRWTREDRDPLREAYNDLPAARSFLLGRTKGIPGWVITRYAPPGMGLPHVYAEIRPDEAVVTRPEGWRDVKTGEPSKEKRAKYLFPPNRKKKVAWTDNHDERFTDRPDDRERHVERKHGGKDVPGPHPHFYTVDVEGLAKRIDVHPLAAEMFEAAEVVYFGIEGCIKADAILSAIIDAGIRATVCSIPSVTLWRAPELEDFALKYLKGKTVYIVPDADYADVERNKGAVINQSLLCRTFLRRCGVDAHIKAPPGPEKGVDDYLVAGGDLDGLVLFEREVPAGLADWVRGRGVELGWPWNRILRNTWAIEALALHAADDGTYPSGLKTLAGVLDVAPRRVQRAVEDLIELGAVTVDKPLATKRNWFSKELDWKDRPTITIRTDLRAETPTDPHEESYKASVRVAQRLAGGSGGYQRKVLEHRLREIDEEETRGKVLNLIRIQPDMSSREIGRRVGIDDKTAGKVRKALLQDEESRMKIAASLERIATANETAAASHSTIRREVDRLKALLLDLEVPGDYVREQVGIFASTVPGAEILE